MKSGPRTDQGMRCGSMTVSVRTWSRRGVTATTVRPSPGSLPGAERLELAGGELIDVTPVRGAGDVVRPDGGHDRLRGEAEFQPVPEDPGGEEFVGDLGVAGHDVGDRV